MDDLIAKLEAATGPDRELDYAILAQVNPEQYARCERFAEQTLAKARANGLAGREEACRSHGFSSCSSYTTFIDSALTLVPEGMRWRICKLTGTALAIVCQPNAVFHQDTAPVAQVAKTPAIALCIAALKARRAPRE